LSALYIVRIDSTRADTSAGDSEPARALKAAIALSRAWPSSGVSAPNWVPGGKP
jgi:hypothetical protein